MKPSPNRGFSLLELMIVVAITLVVAAVAIPRIMGTITGTVFVAKIYDSSGNLLPALGSPDVTWTGGGNGIQYDHCWADNMLAKVPFTPPPSTKPLKVPSTRAVTY
jgi:prepilin-type N-terminal cleavage/methylation domain-containing protein